MSSSNNDNSFHEENQNNLQQVLENCQNEILDLKEVVLDSKKSTYLSNILL